MMIQRAISLLLAAAACITTARAKLPSLDNRVWLGYFAAYEGRDYLFGISAEGEIRIQPLATKGSGSSDKSIGTTSMTIQIGVEEDAPNARPSVRTIRVESLESADEPTDKLEKTVIRGKVTGDATFELTIERNRNDITISNRLIDAGSLTKNPIRPVVAFNLPLLYRYDDAEGPSKAQLKLRAKDTLELKWTDGTRKKFSLMEEKDATTADFNGPGISMLEIEAGGLMRDRKLTLAAAEGVSVLRAGNSTPQMLSRGMRFTAMPAPAKPGGKPNDTARMIISLR
ncbi:MAG: hypothetical protein MUC40_03380 [Akkermansiaceae bacterium]|jgi:hypothetical protein|nr:hypothetical protein [Akkermansiaceae bacterium]